jgi:hypothetical protein
MLKNFNQFNESSKFEQISLVDFLEPFTKTNFFIEEEIKSCYHASEWPNNFISSEILSFDGFEQLTEDEINFPYELLDISTKKGDGKDEETVTGIFKRKSDGKLFSLFVHDAGFIGPSTLSVPEYLEEVV